MDFYYTDGLQERSNDPEKESITHLVAQNMFLKTYPLDEADIDFIIEWMYLYE